ncbi:Glutathione import ATP-binding protein GsiA [Acaryochloris thomasi RCC1774]|uniref:Glutathione import ATP-binding protein GsiA n=1 Tax=Acaryochloris thomasi RCC1774 TaxID=1764569 RepID=A0A2W1JDQ8_9CYAN|nr:ABC transporter ATP-binding protein [Acaryochloris thomasi]PZD71868.1 Glutathione import ATP-binding protein GsiA [Acaryochloris thomasi RCC1774]
MPDPILEVSNLQVQFKAETQTVKAVDDVSFVLHRGQTLGIVGESGSGKSVTSLSLMRLVPSPPGEIVNGDIWFHGRTKNDEAPINLLQLPLRDMQKYRGSQISMIFQEPMSSLNPVYTCGFQLIEAILLHKDISKVEARRSAVALLQEVKLIPSDAELKQLAIQSSSTDINEAEIQQQINQQKRSFLDRYPHELSGGQIQRVMIAMAISCDPAILIADEPTTALDVTVQATILDLLRELRDSRGMSIIFVTHDLGIIAEIADSVAVMFRGKIVEVGSVQQIFSEPQHPYTQGLLACRPQPHKRLEYLPTISAFMAAAEQAETAEKDFNRSAASPLTIAEIPESAIQQRLTDLKKHEPLMMVRDLQVFFPVRGMFGQTARYVTAVNGVTFNVYPGETLGLVGESGCGKTTLGRTLVRLIEPTSGYINFEGNNITALRGKPLRTLRQNLQIIFQDPNSSLDPRMSIGAAIMEPMKIAGGVPTDNGWSKNRKEMRDRIAYLLERVDLNPDAMNRYPHEFSGGQRQRVCIARALALNPRFIICDESVSALDVSVQAQVLNLLKELQKEFSLTYIFISHDLSVVKFMSDRIMVMNRGKIEEIGPAEAVYQAPEKEYTKQLIASIPTGIPPEALSA